MLLTKENDSSTSVEGIFSHFRGISVGSAKPSDFKVGGSFGRHQKGRFKL